MRPNTRVQRTRAARFARTRSPLTRSPLGASVSSRRAEPAYRGAVGGRQVAELGPPLCEATTRGALETTSAPNTRVQRTRALAVARVRSLPSVARRSPLTRMPLGSPGPNE